MPDLVEGPLPLTTGYSASLAHSVLATSSLLCAAPTHEGLGVWLYEARARMPRGLTTELCVLVTFAGRLYRFTSELTACLSVGAETLDMEGLLAHLRGIPGREYQQMALRALARGASGSPSPTRLLALVERPDDWANYVTSVESDIEPREVAELVSDGEHLRSRLVAALEQFWYGTYAEELEATRPLMERSVAYHRAWSRRNVFGEEFLAVTGRLILDPIAEVLPHVDALTYMPSCYVGPYVAFTHWANRMIVFYNCRSAPTGYDLEGSDARTTLYPLLKALAVETRLQIAAFLRGRELCAQQIVEQLDISQPAVSRHLNLMTAAGTLTIRREGGAKYYSLSHDALSRLADGLRIFLP
jgi:ArsR family transcriptional regulator